ATVTIADNASNDGTEEIGGRLAGAIPGVRYMRLNDRGRGRALAAAWLISTPELVLFTDLELSTHLDALLPLVAPPISRPPALARGARSPRMEARAYLTLLQRPFTDCPRRRLH